MRAIVGVISLLVVLAIVGWLASRQLRAVAPPMPAVPATEGAAASAAEPAPSPQQAQQRVREDLNKALEQAAKSRADGADQ